DGRNDSGGPVRAATAPRAGEESPGREPIPFGIKVLPERVVRVPWRGRMPGPPTAVRSGGQPRAQQLLAHLGARAAVRLRLAEQVGHLGIACGPDDLPAFCAKI